MVTLLAAEVDPLVGLALEAEVVGVELEVVVGVAVDVVVVVGVDAVVAVCVLDVSATVVFRAASAGS